MNEIRYKNDIVQILVDSSDIIKVREVTNQEILADIQTTNLDLGETEAIALALEMDLRLIIDEKKRQKNSRAKWSQNHRTSWYPRSQL